MDHKHQKHGKTVKANFGEFGRSELSILGTPCSHIKSLSNQVMEKLKGFSMAYVDADHKTEEEEKSAFLQSGGQTVFTDKISFKRIDSNIDLNKYQRNILFNEYDLVLVNGNHFHAEKQIIVVDDKKPLEKKLDKITDVLMVILQDGQSSIPSYLQEHLPNLYELPVFKIDETEKIADQIYRFISDNRPELWGLVLTGGKSTRMKKDKGLLDYHGVPQREYLFTQLKSQVSETFISCRQNQLNELNGQFETIVDTFDDLGPYGAILSAFRKYPDKAWLVLAVDLPIISNQTIEQLIENRNPSKLATAFYNRETDFPEPLITIWEPKAYPVLLNFLALGYSCPRKVLINSDIELIQPDRPHELINANHPEEYERMKDLIANSKLNMSGR